MRRSRETRFSLVSKLRRWGDKSNPDSSEELGKDPETQSPGTALHTHSLPSADTTDTKEHDIDVGTIQLPSGGTEASMPVVGPVEHAPARAVEASSSSSSRGMEQQQISQDLWNVAYESLRTGPDTAKLMETYEKVLTNMHLQKNESDTLRLSDDAPNMLDCDSTQRVARMTEMTRLSLEKAKRHENVHMAVTQVVDFVRATSNVVNIMMAAYPPAAIAWSGICAMLPILAMPSTQSLALRDGLLYVVEKMEWYTAVSRQSLKAPWHAGSDMWSLVGLVKGRVTQLLRALLEYEASAVCFLHGKGPLTRAISHIFSVQWDTALEDVRSLEAEVGQYLAKLEITVTSATLGQISQDTSSLSHLLREMQSMRQGGDGDRQRQAAARRLELVARFSTEKTCPYLERMMAVARRVDGTCEWIQAHPKYRRWLASPNGGLLLLSADPGCGKSVLSRFLVEEVFPARMPPETTLCYFFFGDSPDQNNAAAALCALIHQVLSRRPEMTDLVGNDIIQNGSALTMKPLVLWRIFEQLVAGHDGSEIVCVLDALDECQREDRLWLVERLQTLFETNSSVTRFRVTRFRIEPTEAAAGHTRKGEIRLQALPCKIKLLVTTRGYPEILRLFDKFTRGCVHLAGESKDEVDQIQNEIEMVVDHRLDRLAAEREFSDALKDVLRRSFRQKGGQQRTYLWVRLVFEVLESNLRDQLRVWKGIVNTLPQTVYDAYDKLLDKVRDGDRDRVMLLLRLMTAAFRPLPVQTAILLLNAREFADDEGWADEAVEEASDEGLEWESEKGFRAWVLETCGFFVTIYDHQLFFIHQTAKQFLQESGRPQASAPIPRQLPLPDDHGTARATFRHSISDREAHKAMAEACIALWKYGEKPTEKWADDERYRYPLQLWAQHFREAQIFAPEEEDHLDSLQPHHHHHHHTTELVGDIDARFWAAYLALWEDAAFIRGQGLSQFVAKYNRAAYEAAHEAAGYTDEVRLAFVATFGHYRLLETELRRLGAAALPPDTIPYLLSEGAAKKCAGLLLRYLPMRPVVVVSEYN